MKKKMAIEEKYKTGKKNNPFDDFLLYLTTEQDKNALRLKWLDHELEKIDQLLKNTTWNLLKS
jgi:hypothetical protein